MYHVRFTYGTNYRRYVLHRAGQAPPLHLRFFTRAGLTPTFTIFHPGGASPAPTFTNYNSLLLVLMISVIRATNRSRGVAPRFSLVRRRTATAFSDASLSPTTSM